jgi:hypothetical protein
MQKCWDQEPQLRPEVGRVLQGLVLGLLQSLYRSTKSGPEFQVALRQFYDSTERENCVSCLRGGELKEFINLLDDVRPSSCFYLGPGYDFSFRCYVSRDSTKI